MTDTKLKNNSLDDIVSIIGPIAGLLAAIIKAFGSWAIIFQRSIAVLRTVLGFFKRSKQARKQQSLVNEYFKEFDKLVDRFGELINENHCDTIPYILKDLQNNPKYPNILPWPQDFRSAFDVFHEAMGKLPITKDNFLILVRWFESIVNLCNKRLICKPVEQIRTIGRDGIPEHVRENYERCKAIYDRFMDDYMDFAKDMNKQFAEKVARDYFQVPKGL